MNGKAKGLSDRNTFITCDTGERGLGLEENLRLSSLNGRKKVEPSGGTPNGCDREARKPQTARRTDEIIQAISGFLVDGWGFAGYIQRLTSGTAIR